MANETINKIKKSLKQSSFEKTIQSKKSLDWFLNALKRINAQAKDERFTIGKMYIFAYDPKTKNALPYYDNFPLILALKMEKDGFLGINLHYIPPEMRAQFLINLLPLANVGAKSNEITRLKITYDILNSISNLRAFKPCLKKYVYSNVKSRILTVNSEEWSNVIHLPTERFQKESKETVWANSITEIKESKTKKTKR